MTLLESPSSTESAEMVIFGITGSLATRKLLKALFALEKANALPPKLRFRGVARKPWDDENLQGFLRSHLPETSPETSFFLKRWRFTSWISPLKGAEDLHQKIPSQTLFYLALPPDLFGPIAEILGKKGLSREAPGGFRRIIFEKPFGWNLSSAEKLNRKVHLFWKESQIYRIDHFLGKETVQNLLVFRFANMMIEPLWNRERIRQIQITAAEEEGINGRGAFYDKVGAFRDIIQNHLLQVLTFVLMEPPALMDAASLQQEKIKALTSLRLSGPPEKCALRGTYEGYRSIPGIPKDSRTETFGALSLRADNWRWHGIPLILRTGKGMKQTFTRIAVEFQTPPVALFHNCLCGSTPIDSNWIIFDIKPAESIQILLQAKRPGRDLEASSIHFGSPYERDGYSALPPYSSLLLDCLKGDHTLFPGYQEICLAWKLLDPLFEAWQESPPPPEYPRGSGGPEGGPEWNFV